VKDLVSVDFFTVPTASLQVLFGFLVLAHGRRCAVHFNVTTNPTAQWTAQQIVEASPWESVPRHLLRDRDSIFGRLYRSRVRGMGILEKDCPEPRAVQPPGTGEGYERRAA